MWSETRRHYSSIESIESSFRANSSNDFNDLRIDFFQYICRLKVNTILEPFV